MINNPLEMPKYHSRKNWTEDFEYENGQYQNRCVKCEQLFLGYKRRVVCKECGSKKNNKSMTIKITNKYAFWTGVGVAILGIFTIHWVSWFLALIAGYMIGAGLEIKYKQMPW